MAAENYHRAISILKRTRQPASTKKELCYRRGVGIIARFLSLPQENKGMAVPSSNQITQLLWAWGRGDNTAFEQLVPLIYQELRRMARRQMAGQSPGHTLQATALVNEAYLRLIDCQQVDWKDRGHLYAV